MPTVFNYVFIKSIILLKRRKVNIRPLMHSTKIINAKAFPLTDIFLHLFKSKTTNLEMKYYLLFI